MLPPTPLGRNGDDSPVGIERVNRFLLDISNSVEMEMTARLGLKALKALPLIERQRVEMEMTARLGLKKEQLADDACIEAGSKWR